MRAETWNHIGSLKAALEEVLEKYPSLRSDPEAIVNVDETAVNAALEERKRVLVSSKLRTGACKISPIATEKHQTSIISVSATGRIAPPFLVAGKTE